MSGPSDDEVEFEVRWPSDWKRQDVAIQPLVRAQDDSCLLLAGYTADGDTNFMVLAFEGGCRFARMGDTTDWAIQERFVGRPPRRRARATARKVWKGALRSMAEAKQRARREGVLP